jgi:hypothetical protein
MTVAMLKEVVVEQFRSVGLLQCLDLGESEFRELPTFFEVSHLSMDLAVCDPEAIPVVQSIADQMKTDLFVERGVELEVLVRAKALVN